MLRVAHSRLCTNIPGWCESQLGLASRLGARPLMINLMGSGWQPDRPCTSSMHSGEVMIAKQLQLQLHL